MSLLKSVIRVTERRQRTCNLKYDEYKEMSSRTHSRAMRLSYFTGTLFAYLLHFDSLSGGL
ncbi:hypothetical protein OI69_17930 [Pectobacterium fontis]|uniref:Uncharacterized protein n=1 Tax=Pectobacterium fontis TaxID=2558042 RepID=A0A7V8L3V0_9GAMM|nr:hypothetical protein OI69_17930 [Pectobacterium fontis]